MNCPRCERSVLDERERDGLMIDVCPSCRGIWLDRGELEKLIARATSELDELERGGDGPRPYPVSARGDDDDDDDRDDDDDDDDRRRHHTGPRRKRRWYESLGDLFD